MKKLKEHKDVLVIVAILLFFIFVLPTLFVSFSIVDFTPYGAIGDTIGGITAPFVNGLAAVLVYLTFRSQNKANKLLRDQQVLPYIEEMLRKIEPPNGSEHIDHLDKLTDLLFSTDIKDRTDRVQYDKFTKRSKLTASLLLSTFNQINKLGEDYHHLYLRFESIYETYYKEYYDKLIKYHKSNMEHAQKVGEKLPEIEVQISLLVESLSIWIENVNKNIYGNTKNTGKD